ncbi:hypothetical protein DEU56DRAFT_7542 [Suillus clintonianus]|uniref:uncharacterized protein n=1 Tax=Suillus clintonianus TaxID=1904413 RepID=UPI001B883BEC|nr:uncharacterized protein DEU56DRAFT_7542 [Suillus clintonianus]KAG2157173.1 hypothetical protein DEU56DRAFT_7542 [Suillus clintonianus]
MASPAPRKTHRYATPRASVTPPRQRRMVSARAVGTPSRRTEDIAVVQDVMDVDDVQMYSERVLGSGRETLYARTDEISVAFHSALPFEARRELKGADFYSQPWTGAVDAITGYALAASSNTCFVWHHTKPTTCYILPCPPSSQDYAHPPSAPFHALVPSRSRSEPGLVLLSLRGDIRFWDSITSGLAGGGSFESINLELGEGEYTSGLLRVDGQIYIASTSHGRLFRLTLTSQSGRHTLSARLFAPPPTPGLSLARFLWSTPAPQPTAGSISALALGSVSGELGRSATADKELWTLSETRVQRWSLNKEVLLGEVDVREAVGKVEDLEGVDLGVESNGTLVVLVSYAGSEQETAAMALDQYGGFGMGAPVPRRIYALVRLSASTKRGEVAYEGSGGDGGVIEGIGGGMKIQSVTGVPYATTAASAPSHPRLTLLGGGAVVAIRFVDVIVFCARDSPYQDRITLKDPNTDQILGLGVLSSSQPPIHSAEQEQGEGAGPEDVLILTAGVLMRARVDLGRVKTFDEATGRAILIRALLTQAILYGSNPDNPLHFSFPPEVDADALMAGAEGLSRAVLESDPEIIRPNHDLTSQLTSRKDRLSWLIRFINDNSALGKMAQRSRQRLATDAEKLYACHQLWLKMNEHLDAGASHSLVTDAIHAFTATYPLSHPSASHDVVRDFFRYRVAEIGRLIPFMVERVERAGEGAMREVGGAVVTILQAALSYRAYNIAVYGVELPMIKPWTSRPSVIDGVLKLVDTATRFALDPSKVNTKNASRELLPELATMFFACVQERLDWLGSPIAADEPGSERDHIDLKERFDQLRPEILETLRLTSHLPNALALAASHADFRSLATLLHQDTVYPPSSNPHAHTIEEYVDRFGGMFAREVVRWCMVHGEARVVFAMEESGKGEWGKYMDEYWAEEEGQGGKCDAVAWLRDLGQGRWSVAGTRLLREAKGAGDVGVKQFMLSVGKLAHLAQMQEGGELDEAVLDAFHDNLDFVSVQEKMFEGFREAASSLRGKQKQSLDAQVDAVIKAKATRLRAERRHGLIGILKIFVRQVLQGKALSVEDTVDVLTLQDNAEGVENYATALHLLAHAEDIPDARQQSSFRRVWCRIYNHDDWDSIRETANITDAQLTSRFRATALYTTFNIILPSPQLSQLTGVDLDPNECLSVPLMPEIKSRFPGIQEDMVGDLARDYRAESSGVEGLRLGDVYHRVRELVMLDLGYAREG